MKKLKIYIVTACISFTIVVLLSSILNTLSISNIPINNLYIYQTFGVCLSVSGLIFITDLFMQGKSEKIRFCIRMLDMYIVVLGSNILLFDVKFNFVTLLLNIVLLFITFYSVYFLLFLKNKTDEISINKKIRERNRK